MSISEVTFIDPHSVKFNSGQILNNVHDAQSCANSVCPIHNPSDHELRDYPLYFNGRHMVRVVEHDLFVDPDDYYFNLQDEAILRNSATCAKCGDMIESTGLHHQVSCSCGAISVDGGAHYIRRSGAPEDIIDTSVIVFKEKYSNV